MKSIKIVTASIILLGFSNLSFASSTNVVSCAEASTWGGNEELDYGNAAGQESSACHSTDDWQNLGSKWNKESTKSESDLSTNDGVTWRTSTDGVNWTGYSNTGQLTSGGLVEFKFEVTRAIVGNHKYDQLESWVDWNQNGGWNDRKYDGTNPNKERIITKKWWKHKDSEGNNQRKRDLDNVVNNDRQHDGSKNWDLSDQKGRTIYNSQDTSATFTTGEIRIPLYDALTEIWLRARVVCENSLEHYADNMNLKPTGYQHQGEVEDYKLTITKAAAVPEPATLFIFGIGLLALATSRKRKLNK